MSNGWGYPLYKNYPPQWDDVEGDEHRPPARCTEHEWADTGMKWTYCKVCNIEGEWDMEEGYRLSTRKKG